MRRFKVLIGSFMCMLSLNFVLTGIATQSQASLPDAYEGPYVWNG